MAELRARRTGHRGTARKSTWRLDNGGTLILTTNYLNERPIKRSFTIIDAGGNQATAHLNYLDFKDFIKQLEKELHWQQREADR